MSMPALKKRILNTMAEVLKSAGFVRKNSTFYKQTPETILIINVQKFMYGEVYFINVCIWLRGIEDQEWPKYYQSHLYGRAEDFVSKPEAVDEALDFERFSTDVQVRIAEFATVLREEILPFMLRHETLAGVKEVVSRGIWRKGLVRAAACKLLNQSRCH